MLYSPLPLIAVSQGSMIMIREVHLMTDLLNTTVIHLTPFLSQKSYKIGSSHGDAST